MNSLDEAMKMPDPVASRRATAGGAVRLGYAALLIGLSLVLAWLVIRPFIYTETPGKVTAPTYIISTPYAARVVSVPVRPGQFVKAGEMLAKVRSPENDSLLANLSTSVAQQKMQEAEFKIRAAVAVAALPSALERLNAAKASLSKLQGSCELTSSFCATIYREYYEASRVVAELEAERSQIDLQIKQIEAAGAEIDGIKQFVENAFNRGDQVSPIDGLVSPRIASEGQSVTAGEVIVEVLDRSRQNIEWVLDSGHFRHPNSGDPVYVLDGSRVLRGRIINILDVAENSTFQRYIFRTPEVGQIVQIELEEGERYPPLMAQVEVRYNYWRSMDWAVEIYVQLMEWTGIWRRN